MVQRQRSEHDAMSRQLQDHITFASRQFDRIDSDLRNLLAVPIQISGLSTSIHELSEQIKTITEGATTGRRSEWGLVVQIVSFLVMAMISVIALIISLVHTGVIH